MPALTEIEQYKRVCNELREQIKLLENAVSNREKEIDDLYRTLEDSNDKITQLEQVIINAAIDKYAEVKKCVSISRKVK
jgi:phage shock protein A